VTNITTEPPKAVAEQPSSFVRVTLDGEVTSYFEWLGVGSLQLRTSSVAGAMHPVSEPLGGQSVTVQLLFGFDADRLYLRVDFARRAGDLLVGSGEVWVTFMRPEDVRVRFVHAADGAAGVVERRTPAGRWIDGRGRVQAVAQEVLELAVPFTDLGLRAGDPVGFFVSLHLDGQELERYPSHRPVELTVPSPEFEAYNWTA